MNDARLTRREFLASSTAVTIGACVGLPRTAGAVDEKSSTGIGMLVDTTRCIGCRACVRACDQRNHPAQPQHPTTVWDGPAERLAYNQWTVVNLEDRADSRGPLPVKQQCLHCLDPACVSVCPVGAMHRLPSGAVVYRAERCIGCRYCMFACPFGIPRFQWDSGLTPVIGKCQFCAQHALFTGPACAAVCPTGALKFGARDALLVEARARVRARPTRYVEHIYGEQEAGGTSWLYVAGRPFERLGLTQGVPRTALPSLTKTAMGLVPWVVTILAVVLSLLSYLPVYSDLGREEKA